jgi:hypothetical protein
MTEPIAFPVFRSYGIHELALPDDEKLPPGRAVGAIVCYPDEQIFEAVNWNCRPMIMGQFRTARDALLAFGLKRAPPRPPSPRFDRYSRKR